MADSDQFSSSSDEEGASADEEDPLLFDPSEPFPGCNKKKISGKPRELPDNEPAQLASISTPKTLQPPSKTNKKKDEHKACRKYVGAIIQDAEEQLETMSDYYREECNKRDKYIQRLEEEQARLEETVVNQKRQGGKQNTAITKLNDKVDKLAKTMKDLKSKLKDATKEKKEAEAEIRKWKRREDKLTLEKEDLE